MNVKEIRVINGLPVPTLQAHLLVRATMATLVTEPTVKVFSFYNTIINLIFFIRKEGSFAYYSQRSV